MANITKNTQTFPVGTSGVEVTMPVNGSTHLYEGGLVSQLRATGMVVATTTALSGAAIGMSDHEVDNSAGADSAKRLKVHTDRVFALTNGTSTDAFSDASLYGSPAYAIDDNSVANNPGTGGARPLAGMFVGFTDDGRVKVLVGRVALASLARSASAVVALPAYAANDSIPTSIVNGGIYDVPTTGAASTITLPVASAVDGMAATFVADGTKNGHTVQYRDATGPVNLTTALTASKRHLVIVRALGGKWFANAYVSP